jgi:hypothetical protein
VWKSETEVESWRRSLAFQVEEESSSCKEESIFLPNEDEEKEGEESTRAR